MSSFNRDPEISRADSRKHRNHPASTVYKKSPTGALRGLNSLRAFAMISKRLAVRRELFKKRLRLGDTSLLFAVFGIVLMITETELFLSSVIDKISVASVCLKLTISIMTLFLLIALGLYHWVDIKLFALDNNMEDWILAIDWKRGIKIGLEFIICCIHPFPSFSLQLNESSLALPMFLRVYLLGRCFMLHSRLYEDSSSRSLGSLNRVHFNFAFIFKSFLSRHSDYVLIIIIITAFLISSWCFRACEFESRPTDATMLNSTWLIAVTFLSIGYGDIVPMLNCGRTVTVITGIIGAGCMAIVIAVLVKKLEMTHAEKYIHDFVTEADLDKEIKHGSANVLGASWFIYKAKKYNQPKRILNKYQRQLLRAIYNIRERKAQRVRLSDSAVTLVEVSKGQSHISGKIDKLQRKQQEIVGEISRMGNAVHGMHEKLNHVLNKSPL